MVVEIKKSVVTVLERSELMLSLLCLVYVGVINSLVYYAELQSYDRNDDYRMISGEETFFFDAN